ncbi:MAG: hypothetical protein JKY95_04930 [Planctomycetaceae bacterium]|nr:hypothetical protein [Planctomycetaceae bacterium]
MNQRATVLKSDSYGDMLAADQFNYEDLQVRCEEYLETIKKQTRKMIEKAQREVDQIKQQAKKQGHEEGLAQGMQAAEKQNNQLLNQKSEALVKKKVENVLPLLKQASEQLGHEKQACLARWETQAIDLVLAISGKVIHRSVDQDPEIVKARIEEVLKLTIGNSQISIRISEQDLESLGSYRESVITTLAQHADVKLIGDPDLSSGDILVSTEHGAIDARVETQLERIAAELLGDRES